MKSNKPLEWDDMPDELKLAVIDSMIQNKELSGMELIEILKIRKELVTGGVDGIIKDN